MKSVMPFFQNNNNECFTCSLANLLVYDFSDMDLVSRIYQIAKNHPLTFQGGTTLALTWPGLVSEWTEGVYVATLYTQLKDFKLDCDYASRVFPLETLDLYRKVIREYKDKIIIVDENKFPFPEDKAVILAADSLSGTRHAVVYIHSRNLAIDNGSPRHFSILPYHDISGILVVNKTFKNDS